MRPSPSTSTARRARSRTATGITLPKNMGGKRRFTVDRVEFAGYGLDAPAANHMDFRGKDVKNAVVVWLGTNGPKGLDQSLVPPGAGWPQSIRDRAAWAPRRLLDQARWDKWGRQGRWAGWGRLERVGDAERRLPAPDFTTVQRLDAAASAQCHGRRSFFEFLFSRAPTQVRRAETARPRRRSRCRHSPRRREDHLQHRRGLSGRPHAADAQRRRDARGQRSAAEEQPTSPSARTTTTSATPKAKSIARAPTRAASARRGRVTPGEGRRSHLERRRR